MKNIHESIQRVYPISGRCMEMFWALGHAIELPRKHMLIQSGFLCGHVYFIERGLTRSFSQLHGEEVNSWFSSEGDFTFPLNELYDGKAGFESVELLEDCLLYAIPISAFNQLIENELEWCNWSRLIHQQYVKMLQLIRIDRLSLSASELYYKFVEEHSNLIQRVNLGHLASYLGMTPQSLSRLRAKRN